jgi:hypothetical protein
MTDTSPEALPSTTVLSALQRLLDDAQLEAKGLSSHPKLPSAPRPLSWNFHARQRPLICQNEWKDKV